MPVRGQSGWKSKARKFAELLGSDDMLKSEVVPVETPTWDTLTNKPTNIVYQDGNGNVTITGDLTANDVVIS